MRAMAAGVLSAPRPRCTRQVNFTATRSSSIHLGSEPKVSDQQKELSGRVALVTGSGRNIGRAIALALAEAGAAVTVNVRSNRAEADAVVKDIEAQGGRALAVLGDVGDPSAVDKIVE